MQESSPGVAPDRAARPAAAERELKFTFSAARAHVARDWLQRFCRRDPEFPSAIIWTLYYDTYTFASLGEKVNSDYLKQKIRVRWYEELNGQVSAPAFVEAKLRLGTLRTKVRERLPFPASEVRRWDLSDPRLHNLPRMLSAKGLPGLEAWQPAMLIRYRRDRFVEPRTSARVSLDTDIALAAVHPRLTSAPDRTALGTAVLEVKGTGDRLPVSLQPLLRLGLHKGAFSKLLAVYLHASRQIL